MNTERKDMPRWAVLPKPSSPFFFSVSAVSPW